MAKKERKKISRMGALLLVAMIPALLVATTTVLFSSMEMKNALKSNVTSELETAARGLGKY